MGHILVVDDMLENRRVFGEILELMGYTFETAICVRDAVEKCHATPFDLIFMDISIPEDRGRETNLYGGILATREIRNIPTHRETPIIAVTAHGMDSQKKAILDSGIHALIEKGTEHFLESIERALVEQVPLVSKVLPVPTPTPTVAESSSPSVAKRQLTQDVTNRLESNGPAPLADSPKVDSRVSSGDAHGAQVEKQESKPAVDPFRLVAGKRLWEASETMLGVLRAGPVSIEAQPDDLEWIRRTQQKLQEVSDKLLRVDDFPMEGPNMTHWVINLLILLPSYFTKVLGRPSLMNVPGVQEKIERSKELVDDVIRLSREQSESPTARTVLPMDSASATPTVRSIERSVTLPPTSVSLLEESPAGDSDDSDNATDFNANVLIVDDSSDARMDLEQKVRVLGHRAFSCSSAEDALEVLAYKPFDVCLLDMNMPGISGMEMIRRIRRTARTKHLPIIVVSGSCHENTGVEAIEMGANDFLTKPALERLLQARINACLRQTNSRKAELAKFLPEAIIESVLRDDSVLHAPKFSDITVMVSDIRGFSRISETRNPVETLAWISDVMNRLSNVILKHGGTIIDYVGDEIMAMWGAPAESASHPEEACRCAIAVQEEVAKLSDEWFPKLKTTLELGIGIHSGNAVCGNTGSKKRIKYGPLGNTVNLASRVQGTTKYLRRPILVTSDTVNRISRQLRGRRICKIRVQNMSKPVELFELALDSNLAFESTLCLSYEKALEQFERGEIQETLVQTSQILIDNPEDGPTKLLMLRALQASLENNFDPVWTMPGK